ncbi:hypothetical protein H0H81_002829, partial [Sphagnurus paluster]
MSRAVHFLYLPVELLCHILDFLDTVDLLRCTLISGQLSKQLRKLILESSRLQYTIELEKHRMVSLLLPSAAPSYVSRLKILRERERAWKTLSWAGHYNLKLPPTGSVYEFVGGLYGNGKEDDRRVTASISFLELPSGVSVDPKDSLKMWTHSMADVTIIDFTMDPSQDLLVLIAVAKPDSGYVYELHLRSLSTNEPHPKAPLSILPCLLKASQSQNASEHIAAVRVQVSGDLVALLVKEVHDSIGAHLEIWDWINNPQVSCKMARVSGIDDFTFLSKDAFLVVRPTGNFEVYSFPNPILEGVAPICHASYAFPPLSDGYMYWYITMSSNPAPGYIPRPPPGADTAGKQIYYPKPDERIHACCLYIFNPAIDDQENRVHCFVFFVNIHTLLHPPAEWLQKARVRQAAALRSMRPIVTPVPADNPPATAQHPLPVEGPPNSSGTPAFALPPTTYIFPGLYLTVSPSAPLTMPPTSSTSFNPTTPNDTTSNPTPQIYIQPTTPARPGAPPGTPAPVQISWSIWGPQSTR